MCRGRIHNHKHPGGAGVKLGMFSSYGEFFGRLSVWVLVSTCILALVEICYQVVMLCKPHEWLVLSWL